MTHRKRRFSVPPPPTSAGRENLLSTLMLLVASAAGFALTFTTFMGGPHPVGIGVQIFLSTLMFAGAWLTGIYFAHAISDTKDKAHFDFLPLTPLTYFKLNFRRVRWPLLSAIVGVPVLGTIGLVLITQAEQTLSLQQSLLLCGLQALAYWLAFVVPLFEKLTRERWTAPCFFPRTLIYPLKRWPLYSALALLAIVAAAVYAGVSAEGPSMTAWLSGAYHTAAPLGQLVLLLASPFAGMVELYRYAEATPWHLGWIAPFLVLFISYLLWRIWRVLQRPVQQWDEEVYDQWVTYRSRYEQHQEFNAWVVQLLTDAQLPKNIIVDEDAYVAGESADARPDAGDAEPELENPPSDSIATGEHDEELISEEVSAASAVPPDFSILVYDETLSPEEQAVRHQRFWLPQKPFPPEHFLLILTVLLLVTWGIGAATRTSFSRSHNLDIIWHLVMALTLWALGLLSNLNWIQRLTWVNIFFSIFPLRFTKVRDAEVTRNDVLKWLALDLWGPTAVVLALALPWESWWVCFGYLFLFRLEAYFCPSFINLQPITSKVNYAVSGNVGVTTSLLPLWYGFSAFYLHPAINQPGRVLTGPMGMRVHEAFVPAMFDMRTAKHVLVITAVALCIRYVWHSWSRKRNGDQCVSVPHYIPDNLQLEQPKRHIPAAAPKDNSVSTLRLFIISLLCFLTAALLGYFRKLL